MSFVVDQAVGGIPSQLCHSHIRQARHTRARGGKRGVRSQGLDRIRVLLGPPPSASESVGLRVAWKRLAQACVTGDIRPIYEVRMVYEDFVRREGPVAVVGGSLASRVSLQHAVGSSPFPLSGT